MSSATLVVNFVNINNFEDYGTGCELSASSVFLLLLLAVTHPLHAGIRAMCLLPFADTGAGRCAGKEPL